MAIYLLLVLLLHTENDLGWYNALVGIFKVQVGIQRECGSVLEQMSSDFLVIDHILHMIAGLVDTQKCEAIKHARMNFLATIGNNADNDLSGCQRIKIASYKNCHIPFATRSVPKSVSFCAYKDGQCSALLHTTSCKTVPHPPVA